MDRMYLGVFYLVFETAAFLERFVLFKNNISSNNEGFSGDYLFSFLFRHFDGSSGSS